MRIALIPLLFLISLLGCRSNTDTKKSAIISSIAAPVRNAHSMVYQSNEAKVYFFGGANEQEVLSDLWVLDSTEWRKVDTQGNPDPRTFASLIYDRKNDRFVLFGGSKVLFGKRPESQNVLGDTWQFKNNQWKKLIPKNAPSPRAEAAMVYNENSETIILFGGYYINNGAYIKLRDTWEFSNNDWQLISQKGPSHRHGAAMAYNAADKAVVLFGGSTIDKQYGDSTGETWILKDKIWSKFDIKQPPGIFNAAMVYDKRNQQLIRFGGWDGSSRINETWSFRDDKWDILGTANRPSARNHSYMVYDENNERLVLFGGHDGKNVFGDIWEFTTKGWNKILETDPIQRIANGH